MIRVLAMILAVALAILGVSSVFIVTETEYAIKARHPPHAPRQRSAEPARAERGTRGRSSPR